MQRVWSASRLGSVLISGSARSRHNGRQRTLYFASGSASAMVSYASSNAPAPFGFHPDQGKERKSRRGSIFVESALPPGGGAERPLGLGNSGHLGMGSSPPSLEFPPSVGP